MSKEEKNSDFSATVNMLTLLAKADMKLKSANKDEEDSLAGSDQGRRSAGGTNKRLSPNTMFRKRGISGGGKVSPPCISKAGSSKADKSLHRTSSRESTYKTDEQQQVFV